MSETNLPGTTVRERTAAESSINCRAFAVVGAVLALTQFGFYLVQAALPLYLRDLGAAEGRIGIEIGLGSILALGLTFLLGPAINRRGSELFLRIAGALYVITLIGMLLVPTELAVTLFRVVQGLAAAMLAPSAFALGVKLMPNRPSTALGITGSMNSIMLAIGPPIGLSLYSNSGTKALFIPAAGASALGLLTTLLLPKVEAERKPAPGFGFDPTWTPALISNVLSALYFGGILAYLPLYLRQVHGPNAGFFFTADALGVLLLRIPTGMLADRYGAFIPKLLGLALTIPGILVLAVSPSIYTLIASGGLTGVGAGLFITGMMGELSKMSTDANRGTAISLGSGSFNGAIFVGSAISGLLIGPGGFNAIVVFGTISTLAAVPFIVWGHGSRP